MTPERYRSRWTGREIDELLASVKDKLDSSYIVNDFSGGTAKIASAELAKKLKEMIDQIKDPAFFLNLYLSIPDAALFTEAYEDKLQSLNDDFKGVYLDAADRDNNLNTLLYDGTELCVILDSGNGDGLQVLQRWDTATNQWVPLKLFNTGDLDQVTYPSIGMATFTAFETSAYDTAKVIIRSKRIGTSDYEAYEVLCGIEPNGVDTFMNHTGIIGNSSLMNVSTGIIGGSFKIFVNTLVTNVTVDAKIVALL